MERSGLQIRRADEERDLGVPCVTGYMVCIAMYILRDACLIMYLVVHLPCFSLNVNVTWVKFSSVLGILSI